MAPATFASERPTLPPLHTLDLPYLTSRKPRLQGAYARHEFYDQHPRYNVRQVSDSSSTTSRTSSPTPSTSPLSGPCVLPSSKPSSRRQTVLFYPCSLEEADAALIIPPPSAPYVPRVSDLDATIAPLQQKHNKCLLLTGPRLDELRKPGRQLAKGARIHPYRLAMRGNACRRSSDSSMQSDD